MNQSLQSFDPQFAQIEPDYDILFNNTPSCLPSPQNEAEQNDELNFSINSKTNFQANGFYIKQNKERIVNSKIQSKLLEVLKVDKVVAIFKENLMIKSHVLSHVIREKIKKIIIEKYLMKRSSSTDPEFNIVDQYINDILIALKQVINFSIKVYILQNYQLQYNPLNLVFYKQVRNIEK